jgi:hypothetical protein
MFEYSMDHLFSYDATLDPAWEVIGPTPQGLRVNAYVTGGSVRGGEINGRIRPVGADWLTVRTDGVGILDVRATMETDDGALIYVAYNGVTDLGEDGYHRFLAGDPPQILKIRAVPRFLTAHPEYLWLNRLQCVNIGQVDLGKMLVEYDVYALR